MLKNINDNSIRYIVIAFYKNSAYLLQYKGVLSNIFHNNNIKTFKTKKIAIKNAHKIGYKYKVSSVKVYQINDFRVYGATSATLVRTGTTQNSFIYDNSPFEPK